MIPLFTRHQADADAKRPTPVVLARTYKHVDASRRRVVTRLADHDFAPRHCANQTGCLHDHTGGSAPIKTRTGRRWVA